MLRWLNSDPVFWSFWLATVVLAEVIGSWHATMNSGIHPALSVAALAVSLRFLRAQWGR